MSGPTARDIMLDGLLHHLIHYVGQMFQHYHEDPAIPETIDRVLPHMLATMVWLSRN